jgi:hypothetical protein
MFLACPYRCMKCPSEGHPELLEEEIKDAECKWEISSGESDGVVDL